MHEKQATGIDTRAMMPLYGSIFVIICVCFLPWFSLPVLFYSKLPTTYSLWKFSDLVENLQKSIIEGDKLKMQPLTAAEMQYLLQIGQILKIVVVGIAILMCVCGILSLVKKEKSVVWVRISFAFASLLPAAIFLLILAGNVMLNGRLGRESDFINLTLHSYIQMTAFGYAQFLIALLLSIFAGKLLNTKAEYECQKYIDRSKRKDKRIGKRTLTACILITTAIPLMIFFGIFFLNDRSSSFIALCIIALAMVPFAMVFEERRPQARELLLIAVMAAIAVVGRVAFFMLPQFKPVTAIVIITGVGLGAEAGFLTGAVAGFVSNFFFGQGPWTPWQMFAFGIIGFMAGIIFHKSKLRSRGKEGEQLHAIWLSIYGGIATLVIYGFIMDSASVSIFSGDFSWELFLSYYVTGFPFNVIHGISTIVFLLVLAVPFERKLDRIKKKYGILEA